MAGEDTSKTRSAKVGKDRITLKEVQNAEDSSFGARRRTVARGPILVVACGSNNGMSMSMGSCGTVTIKGGTITYASQNALLQTVGVTTFALSPATPSAAGGFNLPVSGGSVDTDSLVGSVATYGGIKFSGPNGHSVSLTDFSVNTHNGIVSAQVNGQPYRFFRLDRSATAFVAFEKRTLSGISNSLGQVTFAPLPLRLIGSGTVVINNNLAVAAVAPGYQLGVLSSHIKYSC